MVGKIAVGESTILARKIWGQLVDSARAGNLRKTAKRLSGQYPQVADIIQDAITSKRFLGFPLDKWSTAVTQYNKTNKLYSIA